MTREQARITWPLVVLAAISAAFLLGLLALVPSLAPALIGLVITSATGVMTVIVQKLSNKVDRLGSHVSRETARDRRRRGHDDRHDQA